MPDEWGSMATLRSLGEGLTDAKKIRIATFNRVERGNMAQGEIAGLMKKNATDTEEFYIRQIQVEYRKVVPLRVQKWAADIPGLKTGALFPRIIASMGNPRIASPEKWGVVDGRKTVIPDGEPYERGVRQLWSYCGCGDPERTPSANMTREELLACGKRRVIGPLLFSWTSYLVRMHGRSEEVGSSAYYRFFEEVKAASQAKFHSRECRNRSFRPPYTGCGTVAHPEWGAIGSPWRPGHINMHAHRVLRKRFLRDLWEVSG